MNPFQVVKDFEKALCGYTGAPFAVTTTSCTDAIKLAVAWQLSPARRTKHPIEVYAVQRPEIQIPKRTYVGVPMAIIHAGGRPTFRDEDWRGAYRLEPLPIWDSARRFRAGMYNHSSAWEPYANEDAPGLKGEMVCVSFHWSKVLGIQQGGAILHADPEADRWLRMARFDGRQEGVPPAEQKEWIIGHHCYMAPETAAAGLVRLRLLDPKHPDLPMDPYPDLSTMEIFK